jgi:DNA invertase Pin-like site-specific DNA recombinase
MRAVAYDRASFDRTGEGKSNDRQHEENLRLIEYKRWTLVARKSDFSISAYGEKERPGWESVLEMIRNREVDVVVAYHLDRLTRNMADLEKLILLCEEHGVTVATATGDIDLTNDAGRMVARILAAVARQEVERKAARQKLAHVQRRAEGRPWAAIKMLGYSPTGEVIEQEAEAIREAAREVIEDRASLAELGRRWTDLELRSPYQQIKNDQGEVVGWKDWTPRGVKKVLTNPRLAGLITITHKEKGKGERLEVLGPGSWEPILSETELTLVTAKLTAPERTSGGVKSGRKAANLLTGIMVCSACGGTVRAGAARGVATYACNEWHTQVPRSEADELVRSAFAAAVALVSPGSVLEARGERVDPEGVAQEIAALRERQGVLARSFARGITPEDAYESAVLDISEQIRELEARVELGGSQVDWGALKAESVQNFLRESMEEQRRILQRAAVVTLHPSGRGGRSARRQVEVHVKGRRGEREILIPAHVPEMQKAPQPAMD